MSSKSVRAALFILLTICAWSVYTWRQAQAVSLMGNASPGGWIGAGANQPSIIGVVYSQPHDGSGTLLASSLWDPDGSDYDQWVWDNFTLASNQSITGIQWRGGYDPYFFGSGGPVIDFKVAIYASISGGSQPDIGLGPLAEYSTGGKAGETLVGLFGGTVKVAMYDYAFTLPVPFQATAGTKYWLQVEALQHGAPDWGLAAGSGGDGWYFRKIHSPTPGYIYQLKQGDAAFALLGPLSGTPTATPSTTPTATPTCTPTHTAMPAATATTTSLPVATATATTQPTLNGPCKVFLPAVRK